MAAAVVAAAVLSSLPPPAKALAAVGSAIAHVGPGPVNEIVDKNGYRIVLRVSPNRAAVAEHVLRADHAGRQAGQQCRRDRRLLDARHGDGHPELRDAGEGAGRLRAQRAGARHGRALGTVVRDHAGRASSPSPSCSSTAQPDEKRAQLILLASLVALAAGVAACIVVILLAVDALG